MTTKKTKAPQMPLIIEQHPVEYTGYPFITLIKFRQEHILTIIDNHDDKTITAYVLDDCSAAKVDEGALITLASDWFDTDRSCPLSIELSKRNMHGHFSPLLRTFSMEFVSRIIGPVPQYKMDQPISVKKKRRKQISAGIEIRRNNVVNLL